MCQSEHESEEPRRLSQPDSRPAPEEDGSVQWVMCAQNVWWVAGDGRWAVGGGRWVMVDLDMEGHRVSHIRLLPVEKGKFENQEMERQ